MGCCLGGQLTALDSQLSFETNTQNANKTIGKKMKDELKKDSKIIKLLLLGAGSSGKSTLFRQIEAIHGDTYEHDSNDDGNTEFFYSFLVIKHDIKTNCLEAITKLLRKSYDLSIEPYNFEQCKVDTDNSEIANAIRIISSERKRNDREDIAQKCPNSKEVGKCIASVWKLDGMQHTFTKRRYYSLIENIHVFLDKITDIFEANDEWTPSREDIMLSRIRTTGILQRNYLISNTMFHMYDVGGQRSERSKWIQMFDAVDALIFVVALNGYCSVIFEDETVNKMTESLNLFGEQCNSGHFNAQKTQFILFLNKNDLFEDRLRAGMKLSICFEEQSEAYSGLTWTGPNFCDKSEEDFKDETERKEWWDVCYKESIDFITKAFLKMNTKQTSVFTHVTTATDQNNIQTVFNDVRTGIIQRNLAKIGVAYNNGPPQNGMM